MSSSCIVREFPVPNREYRAAPPERWDDFSPPPPARRTAPRRSRRRRQKRHAAPLALAGLILFCSGFLMGQVAAALEAAANAAGAFGPEAGGIQPEEPGAALLPEEPDSASDSGGIRILGVPGAVFSGASSGQSAGTAQPGTPSGTSTGTARPGTSEHQAGLAVDIVDIDYQLLDQAQEDRPVQRWLMEHCAEYSFILRYPTDKSTLTGVGYEPWHYRYVGEEAARAIMDGGLCLEEYLAK